MTSALIVLPLFLLLVALVGYALARSHRRHPDLGRRLVGSARVVDRDLERVHHDLAALDPEPTAQPAAPRTERTERAGRAGRAGRRITVHAR
jgi:hypothetical protein